MKSDVDRSMAAGFSAHLTKPCDLSVLNATIEKVLSGWTTLMRVAARKNHMKAEATSSLRVRKALKQTLRVCLRACFK